MKVEEVIDQNLAKFLEKNPDATYKTVIEFCKEQIIAELDEFVKKDNQRMYLDMEPGYADRVAEAIAYRNGMRRHEELADDAYRSVKGTRTQAEEVLENHSDELVEKLRFEIETTLDELAEKEPGTTTEVPMMFGDSSVRVQEEKDRGRTKYIESMAQETKQEIMSAFARIEMDPDRKSDLKRILSRYDGIFEVDVYKQLKGQNDRILDELGNICHKYMKMIDEAIHQSAKEKEELEEKAKEPVQEEKSEEEKINYYDMEPEELSENLSNKDVPKDAVQVELSEEIDYYGEETKDEKQEKLSEEKTKKVNPEISELAFHLEEFKLLITVKMVEGLDLKQAMEEAQKIIIQEAERKIEQRKEERPEQGKSGLEDVTNDPNVKFSDVKDAIVTIASERTKENQKTEQETKQKKYYEDIEIDEDNPFR